MASSKSVPDYVTLISCDGFEYHVPRSAAISSGLIRRMLDPSNNFAESRTNRCTFENITAVVLEVVCEYLLFNEKYRNEKNVPEFDLPKELCLELVLAADYLNV